MKSHPVKYVILGSLNVTKRLLIVGANSEIASAIIETALADNWQVYAISRTPPKSEDKAVVWSTLDTQDEQAIKAYTEQCHQDTLTFSRIICCIGKLHDDSIKPEKRLEDISAEALRNYFTTNVVTPTLWLKHAVNVIENQAGSTITVFSARVGSISDNRLGGWYGYRASKAALNMTIKTAQVEYARRCPHVALVAYHPGTVDTPLSKPFQANVKPEKLFTPAFSANALWRELADKSAESAPYYIDWQGKTIPW